MVDIRIVFEGGILPNLNHSAATINNSEKLRESFHKLLSNVVNPDAFNLIVEIGAGYKNAANAFKKYALIDHTTSLLIDLDGAKSIKQQKLKKCYNERYIRSKTDISLKELEPVLFKGHPDQIKKPSDKLKVLLGKYYSEMKGRTKKKKKYGKLKDAPLLIEQLDMSRLIETFEDTKLLKEHIENLSTLPG